MSNRSKYRADAVRREAGDAARADEASPTGLMTTKELADYLRVNERTVLKLAAQGELPAARLGNQWRFRRAVVDTWLDDQMLGVRQVEAAPAPGGPPTFRFDEGLALDHVIADLKGTYLNAAMEELVAKAAALGLVRDKTWFFGSILERENVLTSAVGGGVAFPHTLNRHPEHVMKPFLVFGRSAGGVDFRAADGARVHFIVLMGLRYQELHLPWLNRLSSVLRNTALQERLLACDDAAELHAILLDEVSRSTPR
jgi:PTS system nitrogen regulatory IIA component